MEALKFNEYGVQELNSNEVQEIEGGWLQVAAAVVGVVWFGIEAVNNREAIVRGFKSVM